MKKIFFIGFLFCLNSCGYNGSYVRTGFFKDRFDHNYYQYAETGTGIALNKKHSINTYIGLHNKGSEEISNINNHWQEYWEVNYQYTF